MTSNKSSSIITLANVVSCFITEYHFHPIVHMSRLFYLTHFNHIFYSLYVNVDFHLVFLYVNLISFNQFLPVLSQTLSSVLTHLFFICFIVHFLFSRQIVWSFLSWCFDAFPDLPIGFPILTISFLLYLQQLAVTQTPVKNYQWKLVWKTLKKV